MTDHHAARANLSADDEASRTEKRKERSHFSPLQLELDRSCSWQSCSASLVSMHTRLFAGGLGLPRGRGTSMSGEGRRESPLSCLTEERPRRRPLDGGMLRASATQAAGKTAASEPQQLARQQLVAGLERGGTAVQWRSLLWMDPW